MRAVLRGVPIASTEVPFVVMLLETLTKDPNRTPGLPRRGTNMETMDWGSGI